MKRLLLTILCFLIFCSIADARMLQGVAGAIPAAAPACSTEVTGDKDVTGSTFTAVGNGTAYRKATAWTTSEAYCMCKVTLLLRKVSAPSGTLSIKVYDTSSNLPGNVLATATETKTAADLTTSLAEYTFTFSSCVNLSNATKYWISAESDTLNDGSNYFGFGYNGSGSNITAEYTASWANADTSSEVYRIPFK